VIDRRLARALGAAAAVGLAARLFFGLAYWTDRPLTHDEREYLLLAESLAAGRGFTYADADSPEPAPERFGRAPLYPAFVAAVTGGPGDAGALRSSPTSVKIAQSVIGAIGVVLIGIIAARAGGVRAGVAAAAIASMYPPLVWICAYVLSEALFSTLALAAALALDIAVERHDRSGRTWPVGAGAGVLAGAAALTRPAMLIFLLLAAAWLLTTRRTALAAALALGAALLIAPWTARNAVVHGRFIAIASEGGITFWTGNHPAASGEGDMAANPEIKRDNLDFRRRYPDLSPEALEPIYYREALGYIGDHPGWWLRLLARKFFYLWVPVGRSYSLHSARYRWASVVSYLAVVPFAIAGFAALARRGAPPRGLGLLAGSVVLMSVIFFPQERFRIPVLDPALIVCAGCWIGLRASAHERSGRRPDL
jgi:4-amino-4-deoxy-L-arabinose transferase-like glycosyltransferase